MSDAARAKIAAAAKARWAKAKTAGKHLPVIKINSLAKLMRVSQAVWSEVRDWLQAMDSRLPAAFPPELPPEASPYFWFRVVQLEMDTRNTVSAKVRSLIWEGGSNSMTPLDAWLYRRRAEWATQMALLKARQRVESSGSLPDILDWLLIGSWESDGCIGLWNHAERRGKPHPQSQDGFSP